MRYSLVCFILFIWGCSTKVDQIKRIYNNKELIINLFSSKSVIRSRGQNYIVLDTWKGKSKNEYNFELVDGNLRFRNDSIQYTPNIIQFKDLRGSDLYKQELETYISSLIVKMDSLGIRDISCDMFGSGIDLKIYLRNSNAVMLYVSDQKRLDAPRIKAYIETMKEIDNNWYYTLNDQ